MKERDASLLREHADHCRLLATSMAHEHTIYALTRMADECSELADNLESSASEGSSAEP